MKESLGSTGRPEGLDAPSAERRYLDEDYGSVRARAWSVLHSKTRRGAEHYGKGAPFVVEGTLVLVEVDRLPRETCKPRRG